MHTANWTPGFKYPDVDVTKFKHPKMFVTKIKAPNPAEGKAEHERMVALPSPTTYKVLEAFNYTNSPRGKWKTLTSKRESFVDTIAKKSISPGPAKHCVTMASLNLLSPSFTSRHRL